MPVLFEVRNAACENRQFQMPDFLGLVSNSHFVEHDA